jgi:hypothetical protein
VTRGKREALKNAGCAFYVVTQGTAIKPDGDPDVVLASDDAPLPSPSSSAI